MRTATPLATCSRITEYGPSATSDAISTPRFIGPGCMMITSGFARATRAFVIPKILKYSRSDGMKAPCIRSCWIRSIMITSAPVTASSMAGDTRTPSRSMPVGMRVGGPLTHTSAPSLVKSSTFDRSTRLCIRSPTMVTFRPSMRFLCSRLVHAVARVDDARPADARQQVARARRSVAQDDHVGRHRLDVHRRVGQRLALQDARGRDGDVERVGAEPLLRDFERRPRPGARLVEQVDDRLPAQRRHLLDRPLPDLAHRFRGVEDEIDLVAREVVDAEEVLLHK